MTTASGPAAFVTGATSGIGRATVLRLARDGFRPYGVGLDDALAAEVQDELGRGGQEGHVRVADVTDAEAVEAAVDDAERTLGPVEVLVNAAGIRRAGTVTEVTEADWDANVDTNAKSAFLVTAAVARRMRDGHGSIINVSSVSAYGLPGSAAYAASKAALLGLTRATACDLAPRRIRCNAVVPGAIRTPMVDAVMDQLAAGEREAALDRMASSTVLGRVAVADDVAAVIAFLASDDAAMVTGAVIDVAMIPGVSAVFR